MIPISRLEWSIDRMTWTSFSNGGEFSVPVLSGTRLTGWKDFKVYYRLRLVGDEYKTTRSSGRKRQADRRILMRWSQEPPGF